MAGPRKAGDSPASEGPGRKPKGFAFPAVRGSEEWGAWVQRLIDHDRTSWPDLVDRALAAYAKGVGFKESPPKR